MQVAGRQSVGSTFSLCRGGSSMGAGLGKAQGGEYGGERGRTGVRELRTNE